MKEKGKRTNIKKVTLISISCILGLILLIGVLAYIKLHSFISKINYVDLDDEAVYAEDTGDLEEVGDNYDTLSEDGQVQALEASGNEINILEDEILKNMKDNSIEIKNDKEVLNVLLIGSDTRDREQRGLSDSMIVISTNKKSKTITATSLLRDIYLQIPGKRNNRLNAAYASGGAKLLIETIESNFKIKIDRYISVDFFAFIDIVDAVGGITLDITEEELPVINDYIENINRIKKINEKDGLLLEPGLQLLNGKQALGYSRVRYIGTDFARTARQRKVLELLFDKVKKLSMTELNDLLNQILPQVTTNFKEGEIFSQILALPDYLKYDLEQWSIPMNGTYNNLRIRGMAVLGIDFEENIQELQKRIYTDS